jgi:hypothetical protein
MDIISSLPAELLHFLIEMMDTITLLTLRRVNRQFRNVASNSRVGALTFSTKNISRYSEVKYIFPHAQLIVLHCDDLPLGAFPTLLGSFSRLQSLDLHKWHPAILFLDRGQSLVSLEVRAPAQLDGMIASARSWNALTGLTHLGLKELPYRVADWFVLMMGNLTRLARLTLPAPMRYVRSPLMRSHSLLTIFTP